METTRELPDLTKAGNTQKMVLVNTVINWQPKQVIHTYSINKFDSDGDLIHGVKQETVVLGEEAFDAWLTQEMADASLDTCMENEFPVEEEVVE